MLYSRSAEYALRAMAELVRCPPNERRTIRELAETASIPMPFLGKILGELARQGLVDSQRGPGGGFRLSRAANRISMFEVVDAIDRVTASPRCAMGGGPCEPDEPCPIHHAWSDLQDQIRDFLRNVTLADLAAAGPRLYPQKATDQVPRQV
jgi:Rrf2 family iron-sulfur cluster assembly transcriptional regulator